MGSRLDTPHGRIPPALTRHLRDLYPSLERVAVAGEAARMLTEHPGWAVLLDLLDAEAATVDAKLEGGVLDSRAEYAFSHGRAGGLRAGPLMIEALIVHAAERLEEQRRKHEGAGESVREVQ